LLLEITPPAKVSMGLQLVLTYLKKAKPPSKSPQFFSRAAHQFLLIGVQWSIAKITQVLLGVRASSHASLVTSNSFMSLHDMSRLENLERQISQISKVSQISSQEQTAQIWDLAAKLFNPCTNCGLPCPLKAHGSTIITRWEPRVRRIAQSAVTSYLNFGGSS
jgi:hypothetical protein